MRDSICVMVECMSKVVAGILVVIQISSNGAVRGDRQ